MHAANARGALVKLDLSEFRHLTEKVPAASLPELLYLVPYINGTYPHKNSVNERNVSFSIGYEFPLLNVTFRTFTEFFFDQFRCLTEHDCRW